MLGRFLQADSIVPNPGDPVAFDRYAYTRNNPVNLVDPSGHGYCDSQYQAEDVDCSYNAKDILEEFYGVTIEDGNLQWTDDEIRAVYLGVMAVGARISSEIRENIFTIVGEAFQIVYGGITFLRGNRRVDGSTTGLSSQCQGITSGGCTSSSNLINFMSMSGGFYSELGRMAHNVVHELGHAFDNSLALGPRKDMPYSIYLYRSNILHPNENPERLDWQQNLEAVPGETFADMFIAWTYNVWNTNAKNVLAVAGAKAWMVGWMP
jgi:hypothetical protein